MAEDWAGDDFPVIGNEGPGSEGYVTLNLSGAPNDAAIEAIRVADVAGAINNWMRRVQRQTEGGRDFIGDVFRRRRYVGSDNIFELMAHCAAAVEGDDVLSGLADTVEGLAIQKMGFDMEDPDQEDVWRQIGADLDLDSRLRETWRELFKVSQTYIGARWGARDYKVRTSAMTLLDEEDLDPEAKERTKNKGNRQRKKAFRVFVPTALTVLDPTKVVPVGQLMFRQERLAYIADRTEQAAFRGVFGGDIVDPLILELVEGKYTADPAEAAKLGNHGIDPSMLWLFRREACFRHTLTRADYERFAIPRLRSVLEILDLKRHLRASDRSALVGSANFIVVVTQGSDKFPAKQKEIDNLRSQMRVVARIPVLVGDHRLKVEIVTPKLDNTLDEKRWHVLDARLVFRALMSFSPSAEKNTSQGGSQISELSRVVSMGMQSRRHMLGRTFEGKLFRVAVEINPELTEVPSITYRPRRIALDFNAVLAKSVLELRDRGDISRATELDEFGYDQDTEALRRFAERRDIDWVFQSQVPFSSPDSNPFADGRQGGRPPGTEEDEPPDQT